MAKYTCYVVYRSDEKCGVYSDLCEAQKHVDKLQCQRFEAEFWPISLDTKQELENILEDELSDEMAELYNTESNSSLKKNVDYNDRFGDEE
jgi:hypothetical protein